MSIQVGKKSVGVFSSANLICKKHYGSWIVCEFDSNKRLGVFTSYQAASAFIKEQYEKASSFNEDEAIEEIEYLNQCVQELEDEVKRLNGIINSMGRNNVHPLVRANNPKPKKKTSKKKVKSKLKKEVLGDIWGSL